MSLSISFHPLERVVFVIEIITTPHYHIGAIHIIGTEAQFNDNKIVSVMPESIRIKINFTVGIIFEKIFSSTNINHYVLPISIGLR